MKEKRLNKAHFVLVHGIGGGGWCWYKIRCLMENSNYRVTFIDLKGAGIDQTNPNTILSFEDYNKPLIDFLSSLDDNEKGAPDLSEFGEFGDVYDVGFGLGQDHPPTTLIFKKELQRKIIYQLSPREDSTLAAMLFRPGPIQALTSAQFKEGENTEKVPRIYIKTTQDNVMKPEQQDAMIKRWPPSKVYVLESDHSPFFSAPFSLFGLLVKAAISAGCN
ncbi:unnamed protein product [Fraxinus pennsylvanica]|uniref:Methylesterase 17 n=1 Tax=Fraxinus pennsylvanica TaxID=56036 RepID=A0AAD2E283_9LAMI|nr:unnamed protein product [Fraxinus pennsylvanica]